MTEWNLAKWVGVPLQALDVPEFVAELTGEINTLISEIVGAVLPIPLSLSVCPTTSWIEGGVDLKSTLQMVRTTFSVSSLNDRPSSRGESNIELMPSIEYAVSFVAMPVVSRRYVSV